MAKAAKKKATRKIGRPTSYKPEYCNKLIEHMKKGYSFESFGAIANVNRDTLFEWAKVHKDFSDAKRMATEHCRLFWETLGIMACQGFAKNFSAAAWIFNMKNRFGWRDKIEVSGDQDNPIKLAYDPNKKIFPNRQPILVGAKDGRASKKSRNKAS